MRELKELMVFSFSLSVATGLVAIIFSLFIVGMVKIAKLSRENAVCRRELELLCQRVDVLPNDPVYDICLRQGKTKEVKP